MRALFPIGIAAMALWLALTTQGCGPDVQSARGLGDADACHTFCAPHSVEYWSAHSPWPWSPSYCQCEATK